MCVRDCTHVHTSLSEHPSVLWILASEYKPWPLLFLHGKITGSDLLSSLRARGRRSSGETGRRWDLK